VGEGATTATVAACVTNGLDHPGIQEVGEGAQGCQEQMAGIGEGINVQKLEGGRPLSPQSLLHHHHLLLLRVVIEA
jgi:hypothetical protein